MKSLKLLFILMALMVTTGLKAADTLNVEDLTYQTIVVGTDTIVIEDSITSADAILANYRAGKHAKGYKLVIPSNMSVIMIGNGEVDTYSCLFDSKFKLIAENDDYDDYNTGYGMNLEQGVYYWVVTSYSNTYDYHLTITIAPFTPIYAKDFQYEPISMNTTIYDSLTEDDPAADDVRPFCHAKGYTFTADTKQCVDINLKYPSDTTDFDSYLYLLDGNYRVIYENDDDGDSDNGSRIAYMVDPGTYYIIVTQYSSSISMGEFLLSLTGVELTDYATITYTPIVPDTTVADTIIRNRYVAFCNHEIVSMNGYSTTLAQGDMLRVTADKYMSMIVLDADFQQVDVTTSVYSYGYIFKAEQAGTYYFILASSSKEDVPYNITFTLWNKTRDNVYYIDEVNGNNNNTGIIAQDPLASLDYALNNKIIPGGGATCYLMSDVKLTRQYDINKVALTILPYEGGNYTISSDSASYLTFKGSNVEIGSADSGSITITFPNSTGNNCIYNEYGSVTLNNVRMQESNCGHIICNYGTMVLNNCAIENNVSSSSLIINYQQMTLNNVSIHNNTGSVILNVSNGVAELNKVHMDSNSSLYPAILADYAQLYINGGEMKGNTGHWDTAVIFVNCELTAENRGGILSTMSDIYINGDFTMNNNYALLANGDAITLGDNVTAENVGVILPIRIDANSRVDRFMYNYEEGLPVLAGNVYANYKRFDLYQPYNDVTWYIISDGTLSATDDVAVAEAEEAGDNVNIYPNPTSGMLNIRVADASVTGIRLVDIQGRIITSQQVTGESIQLDMQSLAHGMYFVQLMNPQGVLCTRKVVKK